MTANANKYWIDVRDWRTEALSVRDPHGKTTETTLSGLMVASHGSGEAGQLYGELHRRATAAVNAKRREAVEACTEHRAEDTRDRTYMGQGIHDDKGLDVNELARGDITRTETCRCGAERLSNINGPHIERGQWH